MRVLHVVWRLSEGGGISVVVRYIAAGLSRDIDLHIATIRPGSPSDRLHTLPATTQLHHLGFTGPLAWRDKFTAAIRIGRMARRLRPDVVHLHTGTALYGALARPAGGTLLDVHAAPGEGQHGRVTESLEGALSRRRWVVPVVHSASVRAAVATAWRQPVEHLQLIPLGIPVEQWETAARPSPFPSGGKSAPVVLYVARVVPPKNVGLFVDVAARVSSQVGESVVFAVVGDGSQLEQLREDVRRRGLDNVVQFPGTLHGEELRAAYHAADVFLTTSRYESFGLAVVEAMAAGKPVVATAVGGVVELVDHGSTGLLVAGDDIEGLAAAVLELLSDRARRESMGRAGRERARALYDVRQMVEGYEALYRRLAEGQRLSGSERGAIEIFVLKSHDFGQWQATMGRPGQLPYRLDHLREAGVVPRWTDAPHRRPWSWPPVRRAVDELGRLGPPFVQTMAGARPIIRSTVTMAMFESEGNFLAWLRRIGLPGLRRRKLLVITCWLAELLPSLSERRRAWYRRTYAHVDRLVCFSSNQLPILQHHLGLPSERLRFVPFGVDDELYQPGDGDGRYVLAAGRDRGRDWATLFAAVARAGLPTKVLCRPVDIAGLEVPPNVELLGYVDVLTYRRLLASATVSVVACRDVAYPSGQSVVLESMATGRCTVVTETEPLRDYLRSGVNALSVPRADVAALATAVAEAFDDDGLRSRIGAGGRRSVEEEFNARRMWARVASAVKELAEEAARPGPPWPPRRCAGHPGGGGRP